MFPTRLIVRNTFRDLLTHPVKGGGFEAQQAQLLSATTGLAAMASAPRVQAARVDVIQAALRARAVRTALLHGRSISLTLPGEVKKNKQSRNLSTRVCRGSHASLLPRQAMFDDDEAKGRGRRSNLAIQIGQGTSGRVARGARKLQHGGMLRTTEVLSKSQAVRDEEKQGKQIENTRGIVTIGSAYIDFNCMLQLGDGRAKEVPASSTHSTACNDCA